MKTKDQIAMEYLSTRMEATATMVGVAIAQKYEAGVAGSSMRIGAAALGRLRYLGLVYKLPELNAWRLTREGREKIKMGGEP